MPARSVAALLAALAAPALVLVVGGPVAAGQDRYGPPIGDDSLAGEAGPIPYLSWPGKTAPAQQPDSPSPIAQPPAVAAPLAARSQVRPRALPASLHAAPPLRLRPELSADASAGPRPLRPTQALAHPKPAPARTASLARPSRASVAPPRAAPAPASPPPPSAVANPQPAAVAANGLPPRFYSVDREYGVRPDPIPLPSPFFADSGASDLAGPPPPPPPHLIPGQSASSAANLQRAAQAADVAGADAGPSN